MACNTCKIPGSLADPPEQDQTRKTASNYESEYPYIWRFTFENSVRIPHTGGIMSNGVSRIRQAPLTHSSGVYARRQTVF